MIEKKYLTFDELANRWGCERRDIHYLVGEGDLAPSIAWNGLAVVCQWEPSVDGGLILTDVFDENGTQEMCGLHGWVFLRRPKVTGAFEKYCFSHVSYEQVPLSAEFSPGVLYRLVDRDEYGRLENASITGQEIEASCVFMLDEINACEWLSCPSIGFAMDRKNHGNVSAAKNAAKAASPISGASFDRLRRAVAEFPNRYPHYATKKIKLDEDVRPWLKSEYGASDREAHVFGTILAEHFKL